MCRRAPSIHPRERQSAERLVMDCDETLRRMLRLLTEPFVDLRLVRSHPLLCRLVRIQVLAGDVLRDRLLIRVRPAEPFEDGIGGRAALRELRAEDLVEDDVVVCALVLRDVPAGLRIVLATLEPLGE